MLTVLLTIHMIACVALVIAVMLQRSEGGALGMGGGGTGGLISGRGAAGVLVKTTMVLAGIFFVTSITMTRLNNDQLNAPTALERQATETPSDPFAPAPGNTTTTPPASSTAPSTTAPATTAPAPSTAPDPLAPRATTPAPATNTTPPASTTPAPATTTPTGPAPTP